MHVITIPTAYIPRILPAIAYIAMADLRISLILPQHTLLLTLRLIRLTVPFS